MKQIQELALRDEHGNIKRDLYESVLSKLKMGDLDKSQLPPVLYKNIIASGSELANTSIEDVLAFTVEDITRIFGKLSVPIHKAFDTFYRFANEEEEFLYQLYLSKKEIEIDLEIDLEDTVIDVLDKLFDYCSQLFEKKLILDTKGNELKKHERLVYYFQGLDTDRISLQFNESRENSRRLIKAETLFSLILNKQSNFTLGSSIWNMIQNFKKHFLYNSNFFDNYYQLIETKKNLILRKLEFLDIYAFDFETDQTNTYLAETEVLKFRNYLNSFNQFIKKKDEYYRLSELYLAFDEYYESDNLSGRKMENTPTFFANVVNQFKQLTKVWDESVNQFIYSTQWGYLATTPLKISRILLDHNRIMSTNEIFDEFNRRSSDYGQEILNEIPTLFIKSTETIHSVQHGYWVYSKDKIVKRDVRDVINEFILSKNGVVHFDEVKSHIKSLQYIYPDKSIRAYIQLNARKAANIVDLYVHEEFIDTANIEVLNKRNNLIGKDLIPIIQNCLTELKQDIQIKKFYKIIYKACKDNKINLTNNNVVYGYVDRFYKSGYFSLVDGNIIKNSINFDKLSNVEYRPEPVYRKHIRNEAVAILKETENNRLRIKDLYDQLIHLVPKDVSNTSFYKIFTDSDLFSKTEIDGKLYYQLEVSLLPDAKPFTEEVYEPEETIEVNDNTIIEELLDQTIQEEVVETPVAAASASSYNFGFELNNEQVFDFIYKELGRKYNNLPWFIEGFNEFKNILGNRSDIDQHWGNKILKSLGRVLVNISDFYDRDSCLQRLSLSFETYLKQFEGIFLPGKPNLGMIITNTSKLKILLDYAKNNAYKYGDSIYEFSKSLSRIWTYRNAYAHDQESDRLEITITHHIKYIMDFISLYIFIPYYLKN